MSGRGGHKLLGGRARRVLVVLVALGAAVFLLGLRTSPDRAWRNLLMDNFYFLSLSLVGAFFVALQYLSRAGWPTVIRRVPEAMARAIPVGAVLMLALYFGADRIYPWARPGGVQGDAVLEAKSGFLSVPAFFLRMAVYLGLWTVLSRVLLGRSQGQDRSGDAALTHGAARASAILVVTLGITFSLASIEWIMSLEPHWYSTLFPWYVISSAFVGGMALISLLVIQLRRRGHLTEAGPHHLHDLGKYVFAFSVFWAYLWYSQYMLIWYTNFPEEVSYFVLRGHGWSHLFLLNLIINLALPFLFLITAAWKKNERLLFIVSLVVIVGHWLDMYLMVMPSLMESGPRFGLQEGMIGIGVCALYLLLFDSALRRAPLIPGKDPYLAESLAHGG